MSCQFWLRSVSAGVELAKFTYFVSCEILLSCVDVLQTSTHRTDSVGLKMINVLNIDHTWAQKKLLIYYSVLLKKTLPNGLFVVENIEIVCYIYMHFYKYQKP